LAASHLSEGMVKERVPVCRRGVDHLIVERAWARAVVEALDVVEEVASEGGMGVDDGSLEAEVSVVLRNALVDGGCL